MERPTQSAKLGMPPGTLVHVGKSRPSQPKITLTAFGPGQHRQVSMEEWEDVQEAWGDEPVSWVNVDGVHVPELIRQAGSQWHLHNLQLEDVMNTQHRPTFSIINDNKGFMLISKMIGMNKKLNGLVVEQFTVVVNEGALLSFQEREGDVFNDLRTRLSNGGGVTRTRKAEYLAYRLIDTVVDNYYTVTEHLLDAAESLEERILNQNDSNPLPEILRQRKMLAHLRRATSPLRDAVGQLMKDPPAIVEDDTLRHWHDVHDHLVQILDHIDSLKDTLHSLMDLHANAVNQRMNQVMQLMTMVATIFIPLTFIAGVYGMNFDHIPELHWKYGYAMVWIVMICLAGGMFGYFRKKGWI